MDGVQYQSERLQHALSQLDPHRMLSQEDAAQLQIALANATAIARRVVERQSCHAKPMTEPRSTYACAAGSSSSPLPLFAESIASVASQHGIPTAELRQHNPQLASYGDRELLPPNTFIKLRLRVETPRRAGTPGEYAALNTPDPLAPTPQGLHDGRAKGAPSDGSARSPGESPPRGLVLPSPSPSSLRGGVPASLLNVGRVGRPPTTTPATNPTPTPVTTVPVTIVPTTATAVPAAAPLMGRTRAAVDVPQDRSLMTNESSSFHSTPTPTPFSSPPAKNVAERFPMEEDPRRKGNYPVEAPLPVIPHASGPRRVTEDYRHIARTSPKPASAMDAENDYDNYDTLNSIAAQYGVLTNELLEWNPYLAAYKVDDPLPANLPIVLQKHHM